MIFFSKTRILGLWLGLWPITWACGQITIQFMDDLGRPQERYPEIFMLISLLEVCQESGVKKVGAYKI